MSGSDHSGTSRIVSEGILSLSAYGVNFLAGFFAILPIIRIMGAESFGQFALAIQITALTTMLADFGIGPVILRRMAVEPRRSGTILAEATLARLWLFLPCWIMTVAIGLALEPTWDFVLLLHLMLFNAVISAKLPVFRGTLESFFRAHSRMSVPSATAALDSIVLLAAVLVIPAAFSHPLEAMALYTASNVFGAVITLLRARTLLSGIGSDPVRISRTGVRNLIRESMPLAVFLLLNAIHMSIDSVYLKALHGDNAVGVFNAALRIVAPLMILPSVVAVSLAPYFSRLQEGAPELHRIFQLGLKSLLLLAVPVAVLGAANSGGVIHLAFTRTYADSVFPMTLLFAAFLPACVNLFAVEYHNARAKLTRNTALAAVLAVTSAAFGIIAVNYLGADGAAITRLAATIAGLFYTLRALDHPLRSITLHLLGKCAILCALMLAVLLLVDQPVVFNTLALGAFLAGALALRFFSAEEMHFWRNQWVRMIRGASA